MGRSIAILFLVLGLSGLAGARLPFQAVLKSTTLDGKLLLGDSQSMEQGAIVVDLAGINIPPSALKAYQTYCQKVLGGRQLIIQVTQIHEESPSFRSYSGIVLISTGEKNVNFNKQLLVDGYARMDREHPVDPSWVSYEDKGRDRKVGLWSTGEPRWILPKISRGVPQANAQGTDRDRIISMYGMPDMTRKGHEKDLHGVIGYHIMIQDFYLEEGLVFIYRDGQLLNKQPYTER